MRRSSIIARRTHSSSISRQAQMLPIAPSTTTVLPQPPPPPPRTSTPVPNGRSPTKPSSPGSEKVKEWVDIFDGPMRPAAFVSSSPSTTGTTPSPTSSSIRGTGADTGGISSIIFDGPARPRYIIPGAYVHPPSTRSDPGSPSTSPSRRDAGNGSAKDFSALLSRSSLPPPRIYDGPAFEWELQTKRV